MRPSAMSRMIHEPSLPSTSTEPDIPSLVPRVLSYALIPTMAALHATNAAAVTGLYRRGCKYLMLVGRCECLFSQRQFKSCSTMEVI